jgi:hypothetical protein
MGNRPERSTDLAIKLVVDATHTAWRHGAVASLLQLDMKGAFDTVNHTRLLHTLQLQGFPLWVVRWVRSFLDGRTVSLYFDGESTLREVPFWLYLSFEEGGPKDSEYSEIR